jgi:hypothetical protein
VAGSTPEPGEQRVLVLPLVPLGSAEAAVAAFSTQQLFMELRQLKGARFFSADDPQMALPAGERQDLMACATAACFANASTLADVDSVLYGSVELSGTLYALKFHRWSRVQGRVTDEFLRYVPTDARGALRQALTDAAKELFPELKGPDDGARAGSARRANTALRRLLAGASLAAMVAGAEAAAVTGALTLPPLATGLLNYQPYGGTHPMLNLMGFAPVDYTVWDRFRLWERFVFFSPFLTVAGLALTSFWFVLTAVAGQFLVTSHFLPGD